MYNITYNECGAILLILYLKDKLTRCNLEVGDRSVVCTEDIENKGSIKHTIPYEFSNDIKVNNANLLSAFKEYFDVTISVQSPTKNGNQEIKFPFSK